MSTFRAMNTEITVLVPGAGATKEVDLADAVEHIFADAERIFSRFQPDSELSRLSKIGGPTVVSPFMFEALEHAREYWEMTGGWFDPMIGRALCAAGYDQSFSPGRLDRAARTLAAPCRGSFADVQLDRSTRTVTLPPGAVLDFGGFIKGRTVDLAATLLPDPAAVDAGGDAYLSGPGVDGRGWIVDVEDPFSAGRALLSLRVRDQAVATSGPNRRQWRIGNLLAHHLINPHTGESAQTDLAQVTVVCRSAELADVLAKTAFFRGYADGAAFLAGWPSVGAVFVLVDGRLRLQGRLEVDADA
jgi:FAD:protein FMN transferase